MAAKHFIKGAIKHPGALHKELGIPRSQKIPHKTLERAANSGNPTEAHRARFALELEGMHHKK
jgi:hypothetical protein